MKRRVMWIATTTDEYELPIAHAATMGELAKKMGVTLSAVSRMAQRTREGRKQAATARGYNAYRVEIDDE